MKKHVLTVAEKYQLVQLHRTLKAKIGQGLHPKDHTLRQVLKDSTGYAYSTISRVLAHWNEHHDPLFASNVGARGDRCRSRADYGSEIRKIILDRY